MMIKTIYRLDKGKVGLVEIDRNLEIEEPDDLVIRGKVCGFCKSDVETIIGKNSIPAELFGHEGAGVVVGTGKEVTDIKRGDFVATYGDGCYGDFYKVKEYQVAKVKTIGCNAIVQPLATMLNVARWISPVDSVLINGCGSNALLLAKILKNRKIEFDFLGSHNVEKMRELGGNKAPFLEHNSFTNYDTVVEISGKQGAYSFLIDFLRDEGLLLGAANPEEPEYLDLFKYSWKAVTVIFPSPRNFSFRGDFQTAALLLNTGTIELEDIFDKRYNRNSEKELQEALEDKLLHKVTKGYFYW